MLKRALYLLLLLTVAVSCTLNGKYISYYFTYDAVDVHAYPADTSKVIMKVICDRRPKSYDEKTAEIPYAFFIDDMAPTPIGIKKLDETGKWGYFEEKVPLILDYHGWVKLSKLIPCGSADKRAAKPTYEAVPERVTIYKHPKVNDKDKLIQSMIKGDKVQVTYQKNGWAWVQWVRIGDHGRKAPKYGWVPMKSLKAVGDVAYDDLRADARIARQERDIRNYGKKGKFFEWGIRHWGKVKPVFMEVNKWGALAAVAIAVLFLIPGIRRKRWMGPAVVLPVLAVYMFIMGSMSGGPGICYGVAVPILVTTALYPLLYTPLSRIVAPLIEFVSIPVSWYVMFMVEIFTGESLILHAILFLAYSSATTWLALKLAKKLGDDVCPRCGFYAGHEMLGEEFIGTSTSHEVQSQNVFDHSETIGNTRTDYYRKQSWVRTTHEDHYIVDRCCARCGCDFENSKTRTRKEYS